MRKFFIVLSVFMLLIILALTGYLWSNKRVISGYAAKKMCSCVFLANRSPETVKEEEFDIFPNKYTIKYARTEIDYETSTVVATFWGAGGQTAIYRDGLGCTLQHEYKTNQIQSQAFDIPKPPYHPDTLPWPMGDMISDTTFPEVNYKQLNSAVDQAFDQDSEAEAKRSRAVLVVYKDYLIAEQYGAGFDPKSLQHGWSMTKSVMNALVGILVRQNRIDIYDPVSLPEWANDHRREITLDQLLRMSSGLNWNEGYLGSSHVTNMLYYQPDMADYAIEQSLEADEKEPWTYSSGTANIVSFVIRNHFENDFDYYAFPFKELFHPIGMTNALMEADASGTFVGSSFGWATARDWARFGLLYLNDGIWLGDTILPAGWVEYSATPTPDSHGYYGAHFWLNDPQDPPEVLKRFRNMPDIPTDALIASGHDGQRIFILPSHDLVIVRLGLKNLDDNDFVRDILKAFTQKST